VTVQVQLIDDRGRYWSGTDGRLSKFLGTTLIGQALADYAVVNLGFIEFGGLRRALKVRCRPSMISGPALCALMYEVLDAPPSLMVLRIFGDCWHDLILRNASEFMHMLSALATKQERRSFWGDTRCLSGSVTTRNKQFDAATAIARSLVDANYGDETMLACFDTLFNRRWSLCELDPDRGHTVVRQIGNSYTPFNPQWLATAKNSSLCAYGDDTYGLWVAEHHRQVLNTNTPTVDEVDAIVNFPRIGDARLRYSRLTAPVRLRDGRRLVLTAAATNDSVDLRKVAGQKAR